MKSMNIIVRIFFIFMFIAGSLYSQDGSKSKISTIIISEQVEVETDRVLYVTGEILWFKIICTEVESQHFSTHSKVAYLELIAPDGTTITRVKTELIEGQCSGSIKLPQGINSNLYTLRSYTRNMRNADANLFGLKDIYILNSDQSLLAESRDSSGLLESRISKEHLNDDLIVEIHTLNQEFGQRELVELDIKSIGKTGKGEASNMSITVSIPSPNIKQAYPILTSNVESYLEETDFLPESKGIELTGQVLDAFSKSAKEGIRVYLSFPGRTAMVYTSLTNERGQFNFLLPRLYGQRPVILQLDPRLEEEYSIILDDEFHSSDVRNEKTFALPDNLISTANRMLSNTQIASAYKSFESQSIFLNNKKFEKIPFFGKADKIYQLDDYTRFPLPEFFFEVIPEVRVFGTYGNNTVGMLNTYNIAQRELYPLLLVDGVPVFNQDHFLSINNKLIEYIEIVKDPFWLNTILYNGIINLCSKDGDARSFSLPASALRTNFLTFLPERQFPTPDYSAERDRNLPDFRNTLYWNPSLTTDENGEASVSFYTSDAIGEYEIRIEARNNEGEKGKASKAIKVLKLLK